MRDLKETLRLHGMWARGEDGGVRADLRGADLRGADLSGAYLTVAYLTMADLRGADLTMADLRGAYLTMADLRGANLRWAYLYRADLTMADLVGTILDPDAPCPPLPDAATLAVAGLTLRRVRGRDRVYGLRSARSLHVGATDYRPGRWHTAPCLSVDAATECHPGIYLGGSAGARGDGPQVEVWSYADETVYISARKGARARRVWVLRDAAGEGGG